MPELSLKEKNIINSVLKRYNIIPTKIERVRSAYKIETDNQFFCLKRMKHGDKKAENGYNFVNELYKNGFKNTARYFLTTDKKPYVRESKYYFYVTEWIDGIECSMNEIKEAADCMKLLAKFHKAVSLININNIIIRNNLKNWPDMFRECINDMAKFKKIINKKRIKTEFDKLYLEYIDEFTKRAETSLYILNNSDYYKLSMNAQRNRTICHDSFYYQNIIKKGNDLYIVDLDSIMIDLHINDIGKLIRRLMYKKEYSWDFDKALVLINSYQEINPLCDSEIETMLALIFFPHKFWKLGKKRYVKSKIWNESKYIHKLKHLLKYRENQNKFINNYINYFTTNNNKI